jgi:hypothetical protein
MPLFSSSLITSAADDSTPADPVTRSLRLDYNANHYLVLDPTTTYDSQTVYTFSCWAKLGQLPSANTNIFTAGFYTSSTNQNYLYFRINADRKLNVALRHNSSNTNYTANDGGILRDPSAWYHLMFSRNANVLKIYINNVEVLSDSTVSTTQKYGIGNSDPMHIGTSIKPTSSGVTSYESFDGLLADIHFIDGYAKAPTDFIEDAGYGAYKPKAYTGSFGTNGFHIDAQPAHDADLLVSSIDRNDGDTLFADCTGHTLTKSGDPEHSIAVGNPFTGDGRAIYFDGTDDYLTVDDGANIDLGTGDFTVEFWINSDEDTQNAFITGRWNATPNLGSYANRQWGLTCSSYGSGGLDVYTSGASYSGGINVCDSKWHHIAIVRSSGDAKLYVDGVYQYDPTVLDSLSMSFSSKLLIGAGQATYWRGAMYDYRISDTARYSSDFDVPTEKFDPTADNTLLLIQPDKDDTTFHDESSSPATVTTVSAPTRKASTPYDAAAKSTAMYFDGSDDKLAITDSSDFAMGSGAFTYECWVYFHSLPSQGYVFGNHAAAGSGVQNAMGLQYKTSSNLAFNFYDSTNSLNYHGDGSGSQQTPNTTVSAGQWYHIACVRSGDTITYYKDGTSWGSTTLSSGASLVDSSEPIYLGTTGYSAIFLGANCSIFDFRITKGTARYTSNFTAPSAPFELNPVYIGGDQSGNKNHFQPTNIGSHDVMLDTPTKNYATLNPLQKAGTGGDDPTEGNLSLTGGSNPSKAFSSTIAVNSGKYYAEFHLEDLGYPTVAVGDTSLWVDGYGSGRIQGNGVVAYDIRAASTNGQYFINSTSSSSNVGIEPATDDIIQVAFDADTRKVWFGRNGTWNGSGDPANGTNEIGTAAGTDALAVLLRSEVHSSAGTTVANYGQDPTFAGGASSRSDSPDTSQGEFYFAPPTGFKSLNTSNLDAPSVTPEENFDITLWEGNDTNGEDITGLDFDPTDGVLTWIKNRDDSGGWHVLFDSVRGAGNQLATNETDAELASASNVGGKVSQWNTDGFRVAQGSGTTPLKSVNESSDDYVAWNWKAHQSPTSTRTTYTVKVEDSGGDAWDANASGDFYDSSTYLPNVYMELWENRSSGLVSLGKVAVRSLDEAGDSMSDLSEQTYELKCVDLNAITVKWHYDTSGDGQESDWPNSYNDLLNEQKITILDGSTSEWTTNNSSNDDGGTNYNYSPPSGWANGDSLKSATTSYTGSDTATLTSNSGPVEKYNASAGFSIITYSGNGSSDGDTQEITHSLGDEPEFIIAKSRSSSSSNGTWNVYHKHAEPSTNYGYGTHGYLRLDASSAASEPYYDILIPKSGSENTIINTVYDSMDSLYTNESGVDYVMYAWAGVEGYSKFGKYTGNYDDDGPFIYTGFRPRYLMIKNATTSATNYGWFLVDSAREPANEMADFLMANSSDDEGTAASNKVDFLSNGFKMRGAGNVTNENNQTIVYIAFAESPFKYSNAR